MSRFGAFREFDRPWPIEDTWQPATKAQLAYISDLISQLGKPPLGDRMPSRAEAKRLIHDLHLEWLKEHRG